tara:strand:- start:584 stop:1396 length:813 start_codon:yes stop_codon:yes gene_type:complete
MGIFKSFKKILKKAAPIIGGTIGFAMGGPLGGSLFAGLGTGIGSLVAGADPDDALRNALIGGIGAYAGSKFFGPGTGSAGADAATGTQAVTDAVTSSATGNPVGGIAGAGPFPAVTPSPDPSFFQKAVDFAKTGPGMATIGGIGTLAALTGEEPKQEVFEQRPDPVGESRLGLGFIGNKSYNLDDDEDRKKYFDDLRKQEEDRDRVGIMAAADGGEVEGPGTGTSDSVPARLSDGEFVLTAKAVRGAGGGDRDIGAARMYEMMSELERVA